MKKNITYLLVFVISFNMLIPVYAADVERSQVMDVIVTEQPETDSVEKTDDADVTDNAVDISDDAEDINDVDDPYDTGEIIDSEKAGMNNKLDKDSSEISEEIEVFEEENENKGEEVHYGWYYKKGIGWYYYNSKGVKRLGWFYDNKNWYYLDPENEGLMLSSCKKIIKEKEYSFKKDGSMITGWEYVKGTGWYYYGNNGKVRGWKKLNNVWYYLDPENNGLMLSNCHRIIAGKEYAFKKSGDMITGWEYVSGKWYYYGNFGKVTGWKQVDNIWYYLDSSKNGVMVSDQWKKINGQWYFLNKSGAMATNWFYRGGWFYLGNDGAMRTGWQQFGNIWYYFYKQNDPNGGAWGVMAKNTKINGHAIGANGQWSEALDYANRRLDYIGRSLWSAFNWSASIPYSWTSATAAPGSEWFACYGFRNGYGDCYVMAATFCYMAKALGYEAHQMDGYVPSRGGGRTPHSWVEVVINGSTYVFDPDFTHETGRNGYQISYGTSGTWIYSGYYRMN